MSLVLSEGINPDIDRVVLDRAEYERLRSINAELLETLKSVQSTLLMVNEYPNGPIVDTIWHSPYETLFDFIESAIERAKA